MPLELILGQKPIMPVEQSILSWVALPWANEMSREDLLALRIRQLQRRDEDVQIATERMKQCRLRNKERFDKTHRLRPRKLQEGDWVIVYDSSLDNQHSTSRKFAKRWFGPYIIRQVNKNATYFLTEMDGVSLKLPIAGKRIKLFKRREDQSTNFLNEDNVHEAEQFFSRMGIRLSLTTTYNPEANGKAEHGHSPIVKALVKACDGKIANWPHLLPYALWADRTTHSSVTGFMPSELILGQKPIMPVEQSILSWVALPWADEMSREDLLALRIRQLQRRDEDVQIATERMKQCRLWNKERFDKIHRLRSRKLQ